MQFSNIESLGSISIPFNLGLSTCISISQEQVDTFASLTGDHQWIHTNPSRAATRSPYGGPIIHGALLLALVPVMVGELLDIDTPEPVINGGVDRVRFKSPAPVGAHLYGQGVLIDVAEITNKVVATVRLTMSTQNNNQIVCTANQKMVFSI